ncbi:MAG: hypothetical protein SGBAC_000963 [Bacillariaceae sp.]
MGGGEGAKERRRLQRLAAAQNGGGKSFPVKRNDARMKPVGKHQFQKKSFEKGARPVGRFNNGNRNNSSYDNRNNKYNNDRNKKSLPKQGTTTKFQTKSKKKNSNKPKKPKHLKRKLEQLGEDNSKEREAVLKKLNEFERVKEKFSSQNKNKTDYRSTEATISATSRGEVTNAVPPKVRNDEAEENIDFPRGSSIDNSASEAQDATELDSEPSESLSNGEEAAPSKPNKEANDDSESDDEPAEPRRQRGRRRRGRKDTAQQIAEATPEAEDTKSSTPSESGEAAGDEDKGDTADTKKQKNPNRYCAGRKPVTDFVIGKRYNGKVVYVKPFGVFIDIGCHSDAFCHVSRLGDDYVESPEAMFKEGDQIEPRIVEIDRKHKKITVSLQSEARAADERASMMARRERKDSRNKSKSKPKPTTPRKEFNRDDSFRRTPTRIQKPVISTPVFEAPRSRSASLQPKDESMMTPADLKRARKLARRAARRGETGADGDQES